MYYAQFDEQGNRITSIVEGVHFEVIPGYEIYGNDDDGKWEPERIEPPIPEGFVPISDDDQNLYATNEYIRGADGRPQKKPAYVPTHEDLLTTIRTERNRLLTDCDWTQLPDAPLTDTQKTAWQVYRQSLRDFPETCDLADTVWPIQP